jgi:hypothetical protein
MACCLTGNRDSLTSHIFVLLLHTARWHNDRHYATLIGTQSYPKWSFQVFDRYVTNRLNFSNVFLYFPAYNCEVILP